MPDDYSTPPNASGTAQPAAERVEGHLPRPQASPSQPTGGESGADSVAPEFQAAPTDQVPERAVAPSRPLAQPATNAPQAANGALGLEALVESLLFVAEGPVPVSRLAEALEVPVRDVEAALGVLAEVYERRGLSLQRFRDRVQLTTAPAAAARIERFLGLAASVPLSRAALETLAIVAYQQPVTRPQIDALRGVNSDSVIKNLLSKGLIEEVGRAEGPGRPVLYVTTTEFMQHFGLASLSDLPPLSPPEAPPGPENLPPEALPASAPEDVLKG